MSNKTNKWVLRKGQLISTNEGSTTEEVISKGLKEASDSIINPVVDKLAMQDIAYAEAEFANLGKNIDRQRINRFNTYLNNKLDDIANNAIEAGNRIQKQQLAIEAEVIDAEVVEVKSFKDVFASKLGGGIIPLTTSSNSNTKELPEGKSKFSQFTK